MSTPLKRKGPTVLEHLPSHVQIVQAKEQEMNSAEPITPPATRTIALGDLIDHRDELYRIHRLCDAMNCAFDGAAVMQEGIRELLTTIEQAIDVAAETIHCMTFPRPEGRA